MSQSISKLSYANLPLSGADVIIIDQADPTTPSGLRTKRASVADLPNFTPITLAIGQALGYTDTGVNLGVVSTTAGNAQVVAQNKSSATNARALFRVDNDISTATTNYGAFGINSSTFTGTGSFSLPTATYLAATNGELVLGTTTNNGIRFVVNNGATDAGSISSSGQWTIPFTQTGASTLRTEDAKLREFVSGYDFGAKGDGVTNDTAALQALLTYLSASGGAGYLAPGRYVINTSLNVTGYGVRLFGSGTAALWNGASSNAVAGSVIVKSASMTTEAIVVTGGRFILDTVTVLGTPGNTGDGVYIKDAQNCVLNNVCVSMCGNDGIRIGMKSGGTGNCNAFQLIGCTSEKNGRHGLMLYDQSASGGPNANSGAITGLNTAFNTGNGIHIENGCFNTFTGVLSQQNTGYGVAMVGTAPLSLYNTFCGGDVEANVAGNWSVGPDTKHTTWVGSFSNYPTGVDPGQFNVVFGDGNTVLRQIQFRPGGGILGAYESGTWTPTLTFSGGNGDLTYTGGFDTGTYVRVGNLCTVVFYILFNVTTAVGNMSITNLPIAAANLGNSLAAGGIAVDGMKTITGSPIWQINQNGGTVMSFSMTGTGTASSLSISNCNATNNVIRVSATYQV